MRVYDVIVAAEMLQIKRKTIKKIMMAEKIIDSSWAVIDNGGAMVELCQVQGNVTLLTPLITEQGMELIKNTLFMEEVDHG